MELKQQVTSLELSKRLKELGCRQESAFYWVRSIDGGHYLSPESIVPMRPTENGETSAYSVAELGQMLPKWTSSWLDVKKGDGDEGIGDVWICEVHFPGKDRPEDKPSEDGNTEADARAKMMIYLLEQGIISGDKG